MSRQPVKDEYFKIFKVTKDQDGSLTVRYSEKNIVINRNTERYIPKVNIEEVSRTKYDKNKLVVSIEMHFFGVPNDSIRTFFNNEELGYYIYDKRIPKAIYKINSVTVNKNNTKVDVEIEQIKNIEINDNHIIITNEDDYDELYQNLKPRVKKKPNPTTENYQL